MKRFLLGFCLLALAACAKTHDDVEIAREARTSLLGLSELQLESCLGVPDQKAAAGKDTILSYNANASHSLSLTVPIIDFVGVSFNGYCHAVFRIEKDRVVAVHYNGDTDDPLGGGKDAVCAPIVRSCVREAAARTP